MGYPGTTTLHRLTQQNGTRSHYNGDGVLVQRTRGAGTWTYAQDLAAPLSQMLTVTFNGDPTNYLYGPERLQARSPGKPTSWYHTDALGSVRQLSRDDGTLGGTTNYDPWGTIQPSLSSEIFRFTGEFQDQGLVHLRARWYAPGSGTFTTRDPFAGFAEMPYSLHPYQYAYSAPTTWMDPSGEQPEDDPFTWPWDTCPIGWRWDHVIQSCVPDIVPPVPPMVPAVDGIPTTPVLPGPVLGSGVIVPVPAIDPATVYNPPQQRGGQGWGVCLGFLAAGIVTTIATQVDIDVQTRTQRPQEVVVILGSGYNPSEVLAVAAKHKGAKIILTEKVADLRRYLKEWRNLPPDQLDPPYGLFPPRSEELDNAFKGVEGDDLFGDVRTLPSGIADYVYSFYPQPGSEAIFAQAAGAVLKPNKGHVYFLSEYQIIYEALRHALPSSLVVQSDSGSYKTHAAAAAAIGLPGLRSDHQNNAFQDGAFMLHAKR